MIARTLGAGLLLVFLAGCGMQNLNWDYTCDNADPKHRGPDGEPDPCHERDVDGGIDGGIAGGKDGGGDGGINGCVDGGKDGGAG